MGVVVEMALVGCIATHGVRALPNRGFQACFGTLADGFDHERLNAERDKDGANRADFLGLSGNRNDCVAVWDMVVDRHIGKVVQVVSRGMPGHKVGGSV